MNRKERKQEKKKRKIERCKSVIEKGNDFIEIANKFLTCLKDKGKLEEILNEDSVISNKKNKINIDPLKIGVRELNNHYLEIEELCSEKEKTFEILYGKSLTH